MNYVISEVQYENSAQRTAGTKARNDIEDILERIGYSKVVISKKISKQDLRFKTLSYHISCVNEWNKALTMKKGDRLVIQFPVVNHSVFLYKTLRKIKKSGVEIILLIHDIEMFRTVSRDDVKFTKKMRIKFEEQNILDLADKIVAHNKFMIEKLVLLGLDRSKLVNLEIFDYLIDEANGAEYKHEVCGKNDPIIIAGALRKHKVGYAYKLPQDIKFNLYGVGYEESEKNENIKYFGSFPADELPFSLEGSFGLVWDGESSETCSGAFGEYLRINNPHKTSLYLASGIPVIIWKEAALAKFVEENNCGIAVNSLFDISGVLSSLSDEEYSEIKKNVKNISKKLKSGYYTSKVFK